VAESSKGLTDGLKGDALGEGAARLERIIETVKNNHAQPARTVNQAVGANPLLAAGPGEEWSRRFQSNPIGPDPRGLSISDFAEIPRATIIPAPTADLVPQGFGGTGSKLRTPALGAQIGKPAAPKRSWLGRLLRRRD
jgi:hypothetical protein